MTENLSVVVLAAGGTGGHVFPAVALAMEMKLRGWKVVFITDRRGVIMGGMEDIPTCEVFAGGLAGKNLFGRICSISSLAVGTLQAYRILKRLSPNVVMGFGGYASVPTMMAATQIPCQTCIHEQNAVLGRANRLISQRVDRIAMTYAKCLSVPPKAKMKIIQTGMPVRSEILDASHRMFPDIEDGDTINLLIIGGSQGAGIFSDVVPKAIEKLPMQIQSRLIIFQQCRAEDLKYVREAYIKMKVRATLSEFFSDMPERLTSAHLIISRSGASSVAEILAAGRPSILVPYPFAIDGHQSANAHAVSEDGAGWMMEQSTFTVENLSSLLRELLSCSVTLKQAAKFAKRAGFSDATTRLANIVEEVSTLNTKENERGRARV